jgi:hypothetical protein
MKITKVEARPAAERAKFIAFARTTSFSSGSFVVESSFPADITDTVSPTVYLSKSTARNLVKTF